MPDTFALKALVVNPVSPFFQWSGLWQGWAMFAPNPVAEDIYVSAIAYFEDNSNTTWVLSKMDDLSYGERYAKERWRKWANDNLRQDSNRSIWQPSAEYLAGKMQERTPKRIIRLDLIRHWHPTAVPYGSDLIPEREGWKKFVFYTLNRNTKK